MTGGIEHKANYFYLACLFELGQTMLWEGCELQACCLWSESGDEFEEVKACLSPSSSLPAFGGGCLQVEDEQEWKEPS